MKTPEGFIKVAMFTAQCLFRQGATVYSFTDADEPSWLIVSLNNEDSQFVIYSLLAEPSEYKFTDEFHGYDIHFVSEEDFDEYE